MRQNLIRALAALQARSTSLEDFELWLVGHLQPILEGQDEELRHQADRLDALLMQFGEGVVTDPDMDDEIEGILRNLSTVHSDSLTSPGQSFESFSVGAASGQIHTALIVILGEVASQDLRLPTFEVA